MRRRCDARLGVQSGLVQSVQVPSRSSHICTSGSGFQSVGQRSLTWDSSFSYWAAPLATKSTTCTAVAVAAAAAAAAPPRSSPPCTLDVGLVTGSPNPSAWVGEG